MPSRTVAAMPGLRSLLLLSCLATTLCTAMPLLAQGRQERDAPAAPGQLGAVGQGQHMGRKPLQPGAYITARHRKAAQAWLAKHHGPGKPCLPGLQPRGNACRAAGPGAAWKIGEALPSAVKVHALPPGLLAVLPKAPPGNRYVLLSGDILLMASRSRMVVDAVVAAP